MTNVCQKLLHTKLQFYMQIWPAKSNYSPNNAVVKVNVAKENKYVYKKYGFSFKKSNKLHL